MTDYSVTNKQRMPPKTNPKDPVDVGTGTPVAKKTRAQLNTYEMKTNEFKGSALPKSLLKKLNITSPSPGVTLFSAKSTATENELKFYMDQQNIPKRIYDGPQSAPPHKRIQLEYYHHWEK